MKKDVFSFGSNFDKFFICFDEKINGILKIFFKSSVPEKKIIKTFNKTGAQGDVRFERLPDDYMIPEDATKVEPVNGYIEVAHSETGHNHVIEMEKGSMWTFPDAYMTTVLVVNEDTEVTHLRSYDTHETLLLRKGKYKVRGQREYTPKGWRRVED